MMKPSLENIIIKENSALDFLSQCLNKEDYVIITDENLYHIYGDILKSLNVLVVEAGEVSKSLGTYQRLLEALVTMGLSRKGEIIAFGGGVVGDLAGFVAATYLRGVTFIQIPTTLLAMVDSSVGGKVAVNLPSGKNLVGTFYQPSQVYVDLSWLKTLPEREWSNGMAEVIKYGLAFDRQLYDQICVLSPEVMHLDAIDKSSLTQILMRCLQLKMDIVVEDETDQNKRNLLNFGHTLGHAIEHAYDYAVYLHGEAIAVGMAVQMKLAFRAGRVSDADVQRYMKWCERWSLPTQIGEDEQIKIRLKEAMMSDKKRGARALQWVELESIGCARLVSQEVEAAIMHLMGGLYES